MKKLFVILIIIVIFTTNAKAQFEDFGQPTTAKVENQQPATVQKTEPVAVAVKTQDQIALESQLDSLKKANEELKLQKEQLGLQTEDLKIKIDTLTKTVNAEMLKNDLIKNKKAVIVQDTNTATVVVAKKELIQTSPVVKTTETPVKRYTTPMGPKKGTLVINEEKKSVEVKKSDVSVFKRQLKVLKDNGYAVQEVNK